MPVDGDQLERDGMEDRQSPVAVNNERPKASPDDLPTVSVGSPAQLAEAAAIPVGDATYPMPESIGGYRVIRLLGEGGMGIVWEAEQQNPRRRVALKVMRQGHLVDELHARLFHREAETLGRLRHPNIAAIYQSGHTPEGHDYFAMELVRGGTLDSWLHERPENPDKHEIELRLRMFKVLCEAVHSAHQRGVIHRDLKPKNIVVADGTPSATPHSIAPLPVVKILDFGLARITDPEVQAATMMSEVGAIKGTLPYMSPEQARGDVNAVDLRTDVYALGVVLYEMLSLRRPHDLHGVSLVEAIRTICEDPPRPLRQSKTEHALLDIDLETIVGKCILKEPEERYGTAAELAEDVGRYLESRPILARRPSPVYRLRKFARRHRFGFTAGTLIVIALLIGLAGTTSGIVRAKRAEAQAREQAEISDRVSQFLADIFTSVEPRRVGETVLSDLERRVTEVVERRGGSPAEVEAAIADLRRSIAGVSLTDSGRHLVDQGLLSRAGGSIAERFAGQPKVAGHLEHTLAETYERLGLYDQASRHAEQALSYRTSVLGAAHPTSLQSRQLLGMIKYRLGLLGEAEELLTETRTMQRAVLGENHIDFFLSTRGLSWVFRQQGRLDEAEALLKNTADAMRDVLGPDHRETATTLNSLAVVYTDQGRFEDAEILHSRLLAIRSRSLGPSDPDTLKSMTNLAVVSFYQGRLKVAEDLFREVYETQRRSLGAEHPTTLGSATNLAVIYVQLERFAEAEALHREAYEIKKRMLGDEHPDTLSSAHNLAILCTAQGRYQEAEELHQQTFESRRRIFGAAHASTLESKLALAGVAALTGRRNHALRLIRQVVDDGYSAHTSLVADSDFASLREDQRFKSLVARARSNAEAKAAD